MQLPNVTFHRAHFTTTPTQIKDRTRHRVRSAYTHDSPFTTYRSPIIARNAAMCSGVVPQQPPRIFAPARIHSRACTAKRAGSIGSGAPPSRSLGLPVFGFAINGIFGSARCIARKIADSGSGPRPQFAPSASTLRSTNTCAAASGGTPSAVRP